MNSIFFDRLKDIPDKKLGLTVGSSGINNKRFVETISRGGNAAKLLGIELNDIKNKICLKRKSPR